MSEEALNVTWVETAHSRYPIYIGQSLLTSDFFTEHFPHLDDIVVVTDDNVGPLYLPALEKALNRKSLPCCTINSGEKYKTLQTAESIFETLIQSNAHRDTTLITLGGGVVGDLGGFAASCYQRGIPFIQIPTTLLAQVDASVGGKTGFNFLSEKNVIGSFYQPEAVIIDIDVIDTLSQREYLAGLAEVVKYAMLGDSEFFQWLEENHKAIASANKQMLIPLIQTCCKMKAKIVCEDEREKGIRAILNLGHTFGHALESLTGYETFLHGEAVAIGLYCCALMSYKRGNLSMDSLTRIDDLLKALDLPRRVPKDIVVEDMVNCMTRDKKISQSRLNVVLLQTIGEAYLQPIDQLVDMVDVVEAAKQK